MTEFQTEEEAVQAIRNLKDGKAVLTTETAWSERHQAFLTMVFLYDAWGGGSCNGTGVSKMESLSNAYKVANILLNSRKAP